MDKGSVPSLWLKGCSAAVGGYYQSRYLHSASELSGFTSTSSLTMNEKSEYCTRLCQVRY